MRALVVLLAASVAVNAYLIATRSRGGAVIAVPEAAPSSERAVFVPTPQHPTSYGVLERKVLEQRVLAAEAEVERHLPLHERYAKAARSNETERRAGPYLDRIFKDGKYALECHGRVCKLDPDTPNRDWMEPLQTTMPERVTLFRIMSFSPEGTFLDLFGDGEELAAKIHYEAAAARAACMNEPARSGDLTLQLVMDTGRVKLHASGSLVDQTIGRCLVKAYEEAIAKVPVPPGLQVEDEGHTWTFPLEER